MRWWWLWGRKGSVTIQIVNFDLGEWHAETMVSGHLVHAKKLSLNWASGRWPWNFFSYPFAHCEHDHPKLVSHRWELSGDWWRPLAECTVPTRCCEGFLEGRQAPLAGIPHCKVLGTVDKAVNISKLSQRFLKLLTVHEGRIEIYVKSFGAEVWD